MSYDARTGLDRGVDVKAAARFAEQRRQRDEECGKLHEVWEKHWPNLKNGELVFVGFGSRMFAFGADAELLGELGFGVSNWLYDGVSMVPYFDMPAFGDDGTSPAEWIGKVRSDGYEVVFIGVRYGAGGDLEVVPDLSKIVAGQEPWLTKADGEKRDEKTCLSYWFPLVQAAGLPVPRTHIVRTECKLRELLDGKIPGGFDLFELKLAAAAADVGFPCFLRTGMGSDKHRWERSCFLDDPANLRSHVAALVEWSECVDMLDLPHDVWVVREMMRTRPLFYAFTGKMPIVREFRYFVRDGVIEHQQPYWPAASIGMPDRDDWRELLRVASLQNDDDGMQLHYLAEAAGRALGGYWSVDFLQDVNGMWWLTDCAEGERSFKYDPHAPEIPKKVWCKHRVERPIAVGSVANCDLCGKQVKSVSAGMVELAEPVVVDADWED